MKSCWTVIYSYFKQCKETPKLVEYYKAVRGLCKTPTRRRCLKWWMRLNCTETWHLNLPVCSANVRKVVFLECTVSISQIFLSRAARTCMRKRTLCPFSVFRLGMVCLEFSSSHRRYVIIDRVIDSSNLMSPLLSGNQLTIAIPCSLVWTPALLWASP